MARRRDEDLVARNMRNVGEVTGRSIALAEEAALKSLDTARKISREATKDFMQGFRRGRGSTRKRIR